MLDALLPDVGGLWVAVVAIVAGLFGWAKLAGRKADRAERRADAAEAHIETRKDVEDAVEASRAGGGTWHDRLRAHAEKRKP